MNPQTFPFPSYLQFFHRHLPHLSPLHINAPFLCGSHTGSPLWVLSRVLPVSWQARGGLWPLAGP